MGSLETLLICVLITGVHALERSVSVEILTNASDIRVGGTMIFKCTAMNLAQDFSLEWEHNGVPLESNGTLEYRYAISGTTFPNGTTQYLDIMDIREEDAGVYRCQANPTIGGVEETLASDTVTLKIPYFPDAIYPICSPSGIINQTEGDELALSCTTDSGYPTVSLQINKTVSNDTISANWSFTENGVGLMKSINLTLDVTDDGASYQCKITSHECFQGMESSCTIGPLLVQPRPTTPSHTAEDKELSTQDIQTRSRTQTENVRNVQTTPTTNFEITTNVHPTTSHTLAQPQSSLARILLAVVVIVLLVAAILVVLRRRGYLRWKHRNRGTGETDVDFDVRPHAIINAYEMEQYATERQSHVENVQDSMYQEIPVTRTLPCVISSLQPTTDSGDLIGQASGDQEQTTTIELADCDPQYQQEQETNVMQNTAMPLETANKQSDRPPASEDDVIYAHPIKKPKRSFKKKDGHCDEESETKHFDFGVLYAKVQKKLTGDKDSNSVSAATNSASAYSEIPAVSVTSKPELPPREYLSTTISRDEGESDLSPEDETAYAEI